MKDVKVTVTITNHILKQFYSFLRQWNEINWVVQLHLLYIYYQTEICYSYLYEY